MCIKNSSGTQMCTVTIGGCRMNCFFFFLFVVFVLGLGFFYNGPAFSGLFLEFGQGFSYNHLIYDVIREFLCKKIMGYMSLYHKF